MNLRHGLASTLVLALATSSSFARAEEAEKASSSSPKASRVLTIAGTTVLGVGYLPMVGAALPSTGGVFVRVVYTLGTFGLGCWAGEQSPDDDTPRDEYHRSHTPSICSGHYGGIQLLLPIAGPILFAQNHPKDSILNPQGRPLEGSVRAALYVSAGVQALGIVLVLAGAVVAVTERGKPANASSSSSSLDARPRPRLRVLPSVTATSLGVSASLVDF